MQQTIEHADRHAHAHRPAEPARPQVTALAPIPGAQADTFVNPDDTFTIAVRFL